MKAFKLTGNLSIAFGILAALSCIQPSFLMVGMLCSIVGLIFSVFNIFIYTRNEIGSRTFIRAHLGMILSSAPIVYILIIILFFKGQ